MLLGWCSWLFHYTPWHYMYMPKLALGPQVTLLIAFVTYTACNHRVQTRTTAQRVSERWRTTLSHTTRRQVAKWHSSLRMPPASTTARQSRTVKFRKSSSTLSSLTVELPGFISVHYRLDDVDRYSRVFFSCSEASGSFVILHSMSCSVLRCSLSADVELGLPTVPYFPGRPGLIVPRPGLCLPGMPDVPFFSRGQIVLKWCGKSEQDRNVLAF